MENKILSCTSATALQHNVCEADYNSAFQQDYTWSRLWSENYVSEMMENNFNVCLLYFFFQIKAYFLLTMC